MVDPQLGAQLLGHKDSEVSKRIDILATALFALGFLSTLPFLHAKCAKTMSQNRGSLHCY